MCFVKDIGTWNAIFMNRMILEQAMQNMYIYTRTFDKIQHKDVFELLRKLDLFDKHSNNPECLQSDKKKMNWAHTQK